MRHGSLDEALALQRELSRRVVSRDDFGTVRHVAGLDVAYREGSTRAAAVLLSFPTLDLIETAVTDHPASLPYVPGLFSFREAPAALAALARLSRRPDVVLCDGHGIAHPQRFGLASHLGILGDVPTIGVAKSLLCGTHGLLAEDRGATADLVDSEEVIGAAVRTRTSVRPVYVSVGHRLSLPTAVALVLACAPRFRLPEPARLADRACRF